MVIFFGRGLLLTEKASEKVSDDAPEKIQIDLEVFCPRIFGFVVAKVYGLVQFHVTSGDFEKRYCFSLKDGDPDARLGTTSMGTRKGAMRSMLAATTTKALEAFISDLESRSESTSPSVQP
jgi:hypothetical protein